MLVAQLRMHDAAGRTAPRAREGAAAPGSGQKRVGTISDGVSHTTGRARLLGLSVDGVKKHLKIIFAALGASSRTEAVSLALSNKLLNS